jgi:hypothetical protein
MTRSASTGGQTQRVEGRDVAHDITDDDRDRGALPEQVDAKIAQVGDAEREVHLLRFFEGCCLLGIQQLGGDLLDHRRIHHLLIDRYGIALDLDVDRCTGADEDVRSLPVGHHLKELVEDHSSYRRFNTEGGDQSPRSRSLMLVLARVRASTFLTITAQ